MKLLILLLFVSFNSYAEIRVKITHKVSGQEFQKISDTQPEIDLWKSKMAAWINSWGNIVDYDITQEDITAALNAERSKRIACDALEVKLKTPADLTLVEINQYLRCR